MGNLCERFRGIAGKLLRTGFFSVFVANAMCQVLSFLGGMVVVRVMSKGDHGLYAYIKNCYGMLFVLNDLGCAVAAMQFCSEEYSHPARADGIFYYGLSRGLAFSLLSGALMLLSPLFYPYNQPGAARMVQLLCLAPPLITANSFLMVNLRVRLQNNSYARLNIFTTVCNYAAILPLAYWFGVTGAVLSVYVIQTLNLLYALWESRSELPSFGKREPPDASLRKAFLRLGFGSQLNNGLGGALMLLDVFLIGLFIADTEIISSYKVATTIPSALASIPAAVMVYVIPHFARNRANIGWIRGQCRILFSALAGMNLLIVLGGWVLFPFFIPLIFGSQYADAVPCFRVLLIGYFFSATLQTPAANIIYTQRKVRVNVIITVLSGVCNCILDVVLILRFQSIGAAYATTLVHVIAGGLNMLYLHFGLLRPKPGRLEDATSTEEGNSP